MFSGIKNPFGNFVTGLSISDPERHVLSISASLKSEGLQAVWLVSPIVTPKNLSKLLFQRGWRYAEALPLMIADLDQICDHDALSNLMLHPVTDSRELALWIQLLAEGSAILPKVAELFGLVSSDRYRVFTAFLDGRPVGCCALTLHEGVAGIYCVCTLEKFRGRGIGTALTARPLRIARDLGYRIGTLQASKMGYPVYERLGFIDVGSTDLYVFSPTTAE
jgi:GNAT superfamily N-acetyltransferase